MVDAAGSGRAKVPGRSGRGLRKCSIAERLVRPELVVESGVLAGDVLEMAEAEAQEVVKALAFQGAYPTLPRGSTWRGSRMSIGPPIHPRINTAVSHWSEIWRCVAHSGASPGSRMPLSASMIVDPECGREGQAVTQPRDSSAAATHRGTVGTGRS